MWLFDPRSKRTKLSERVLPNYSRGEEIFNMVSHIVGGAIGIATLVLGIIFAAANIGTRGILSAIVFGVSMIMLYTMSSIYHGLSSNIGKKVFQIIDHCTIYFLIAGTYTPILVCSLADDYPVAAWVTFGSVWGLTVLNITLNAIDLKKYEHMSMIGYIGIGWAIAFSLGKVYATLGLGGFLLLLFGGVAYTIGAVIYRFGSKIPYMHSVFHLFVLAGSICHSLCILIYVFF